METFAQNVLGWLDWHRLCEPGDALSEPAWKNFASRAERRRALDSRLWRDHSEKEKEPGVVSRRRTLAQRQTAGLQARRRNVAGTFSRVRYSRFHSRHARSSAAWKMFSSAAFNPSCFRQVARCARAEARRDRRKTASKNRQGFARQGS